MSHDAINSNYLFFHDFVQPKLTLTALKLAGGCEFTADDLLAQAADFFANDFEYLFSSQSVKHGKRCLLRAARDARIRRRGQRSLEQMLEQGWDAAGEDGRAQDFRMDLASWSSLVERAVGQWGCPQLRSFWQATKAGMDRADAAAAAGLSQVQVTRMLDFMALKLTGRPRIKGKPGKGDQQQGSLFELEPDWQGV